MYAMKNSKDGKRENDITTIYKFLILIFIANIYISGVSIVHIILMTVLLFIFLNMVRTYKKKKITTILKGDI